MVIHRLTSKPFSYCILSIFPINFKKVALLDNLFDADFSVVCQLFTSLYAT